jgi:hypothetical protein
LARPRNIRRSFTSPTQADAAREVHGVTRATWRCQAARALIGHTPIFVPRIVLLETEWVLRSIHGMQPARTIPA